MALIVQDRVKVNTTTTGTGTIVLSATAPTGYQSFAVIGNNNTTYYTIAGQTTDEWEVGIGTYFLANSSLSRTTILSSSAANAAVTFSAGTKDVFVTYPAERSVYGNATNVTVFTDTLFALQDDADPTKQATFNVGTINTNNTIAYNLPTSTTANAAVTLAGLNVAQTFSAGQTFSGSVSMSAIASNISIGTSQVAPLLTFGGLAQTGTMTVGRSNATQTTDIQAGATVAAATKTLNIGTNGISGSFTNITLGSANGTNTTVNGNVTALGNVTVRQLLTAGANAVLGGATNPIFAMTGNANNYIQGYIYNLGNLSQSSADLVVYPNNGTDAAGWVDMGITSLAFNQATYSVTGPNEGYIFMSAPANTSSGNLVFATDSTGSINAMQFYTGGFAQTKANVAMTLSNAGTLVVKGSIKANSTGFIFPDNTTQTTAATPGLTAAGNSSIGIFNTNITANAIIATGTNGFSVGPVTTANGVTVTVGANATWVVL
jgi:hypothetical protein